MVYLTSEYDLPVTIDFTTSNGTASAGTDYVATSGSVVFAPGRNEQANPDHDDWRSYR